MRRTLSIIYFVIHSNFSFSQNVEIQDCQESIKLKQDSFSLIVSKKIYRKNKYLFSRYKLTPKDFFGAYKCYECSNYNHEEISCMEKWEKFQSISNIKKVDGNKKLLKIQVFCCLSPLQSIVYYEVKLKKKCRFEIRKLYNEF